MSSSLCGPLEPRILISSRSNRVSSRPAREVRPVVTSPSTLVVVVSSEVVSLRYVDGKTLIGMGTRASKSSLTGFGSSYLSNPFRQTRGKTRVLGIPQGTCCEDGDDEDLVLTTDSLLGCLK